jgi:hypothetical protein
VPKRTESVKTGNPIESRLIVNTFKKSITVELRKGFNGKKRYAIESVFAVTKSMNIYELVNFWGNDEKEEKRRNRAHKKRKVCIFN